MLNQNQVRDLVFADIAAAKAAGRPNEICYVQSMKTFYDYVVAGGSYTANDTSILTTANGGNTRWRARAGQYVVDVVDFKEGIIETITSHSATEAVTAATMYGNLHKITGAFVLTLPDAVIGMHGLFRASTATEFSLKAGASDHQEMFDGTVISDGDKQTSGGTKNEFIQVYCEVANTWITIGQNGAFTDGGA